MDLLKDYFRGQSQASVLRHSLGLERLPGAPALADSLMVVAFDTEHYERSHDRMTEIGVCIWETKEMRNATGTNVPSMANLSLNTNDIDSGIKEVKEEQIDDFTDLGPYGEKLLQKMLFYHVRIEPNAHLINRKFCPGNPKANHFGNTRFLTVQETGEMLTELFNRPIDAQKPELGFCPVVILGQAIQKNDVVALDKALGFDIFALPHFMSTLDTQDLALESTWWRPPAMHPNNKIGLRTLVEDVIGFSYREHDPHTACNDTALTVVCALQMVLPTQYTANQSKTLDQVVKDVGELSKNVPFEHGRAKYCIRCGLRGHFDKFCKAKVLCTKCNGIPGRRGAAGSHDISCCCWHA